MAIKAFPNRRRFDACAKLRKTSKALWFLIAVTSSLTTIRRGSPKVDAVFRRPLTSRVIVASDYLIFRIGMKNAQ